jgi:tetratricopeptide (TPR) repeat protein
MSKSVIAAAAACHADGVTATNEMRPAAGEKRFRAALRLLDRGPVPDAEQDDAARLRARVLVSLAYAVAEQGDTDAGLRHLDAAERLIPPWQRGTIHGQRAILLRRIGRHDEALSQYDAALAVLDGDAEPTVVAKMFLNRGVLHLRAIRPRPARADLLRAAAVAHRYGLSLIAAKARHNLALLDLLAGALPAVLGTFTELAEEYAQQAPGILPVLALDRARALVAGGLYREADEELASAVALLHDQGMRQDEGEALLVRAEAALLAAHPAAAHRWAREAGRLFTRRDNHRWASLAALVDLRADYALSRPSAAFVRRAEDMAVQLAGLGLDEDARVAGLLATRARAATGRTAEAVDGLHRYGRLRPADRLDTRLLCRLTRAEVADATAHPSAASRQLTVGLAELHRYRSHFGCLDLRSGAAVHGRDLAATGLRRALRHGSVSAVYRWSERSRAQSLLLPPVHPPDDDRYAAALEELRQLRLTIREAELTGEPTATLHTRCTALERLIRHRSWSIAGPVAAAEPAPLGMVESALDESAMIIYLEDRAVLHALIVVAGSAQLMTVGPVHAIDEAAMRLRADLNATAGRILPARLATAIRESTRRDAGALAEAVLNPLWTAVGDRDLVVVPTGALLTVPWGLLPGCVGRAITVASSATSWLAARRRLEAAPADRPVALVAGPGNRHADLEIERIAQVYARATVLCGPAATVAVTAAAIDGAPLAHVAAHGRHQAENPLFSRLELADGPLMGHDLQRLAVPPRVAVLSCCELGLNDVRPGDETIGFSAALLAAGTATVIGSVGLVADDAAMRTMVALHRLMAAGARPSAALADAMASDEATGFVCFGAG